MIPGDCDNLGFIVDHREAHLVKSSSNRIMIRRKEYRKCGEDFIPPELSPVRIRPEPATIRLLGKS